MAIIRSLAVGKARKSAGNLTFATVEGRTIAREKPVFVKNPRTPAQLEQRDKMRKVVAAYRDFGVKIKSGFTVLPKYTSQYNEFVKRNIGLAEQFVVDDVTGAVSNVTGTIIANGSLRFVGGARMYTTAQNKIYFDMGKASGWTAKLGDVIIFAAVRNSDNSVVVKEVALSNSQLIGLNSGGGDDVDSGFEATDYSYAGGFYYSPSSNASSFGQIVELDTV